MRLTRLFFTRGATGRCAWRLLTLVHDTTPAHFLRRDRHGEPTIPAIYMNVAGLPAAQLDALNLRFSP